MFRILQKIAMSTFIGGLIGASYSYLVDHVSAYFAADTSADDRQESSAILDSAYRQTIASILLFQKNGFQLVLSLERLGAISTQTMVVGTLFHSATYVDMYVPRTFTAKVFEGESATPSDTPEGYSSPEAQAAIRAHVFSQAERMNLIDRL